MLVLLPLVLLPAASFGAPAEAQPNVAGSVASGTEGLADGGGGGQARPTDNVFSGKGISYEALVKLLEDEAARARLIQELRGIAEGSDAAGSAANGNPTAAAAPSSATAAGTAESNGSARPDTASTTAQTTATTAQTTSAVQSPASTRPADAATSAQPAASAQVPSTTSVVNGTSPQGKATPEGSAPSTAASSEAAGSATASSPEAASPATAGADATDADDATGAAATGTAAAGTAAAGTAAAGTDETGADATDAAAAGPDSAAASLPVRIADSTQDFVQSVADDVMTAVAMFRSVGSGDPVRGVSWDTWLNSLGALALVVIATLVAYLVLRLLARFAYAYLDKRVEQKTAAYLGALNEQAQAVPPPLPPEPGARLRYGGQGQPRARLAVLYSKVLAMVGALVVDVAVVLLAAGVGYGVGIITVGPIGAIGLFETMFINAFMATEITKALVRGVFATRFPYLRLFSMSDDLASYWNRWLAIVISVVGYGILVAVPILRLMVSPAAGQAVGLVVMLGVYIYALKIILKNRIPLRERLRARADHVASTFFGSLLRMLARVWHVVAIAYFTVLLVVSQIDPDEALPFMAEATFQTAIAVGVALLISAVFSLLLAHRIRLSNEWRARLPMLEARLNSYVPAVLHGLRLLILIVATLVVLDAWRVFNLAGWLSSESGQRTMATLVHVAIILLMAACIWVVVASLIEHRLSALPGADGASAREKTLLSLFRNAALIVIVTMTVLVVLSQIGIDIAPLIAGAGVVGLAVGFGAQKLVQDIINGVFIQLENGMNQNDVVEVAGIFGTVEKLTIRSVGIRTLDGGFHMVPFSSIDRVSNHMRDFSYHLGHYTVAYRESVDDAIYHLEQAFKELKQDEVLAPEILEDISIPGVTALDEKGFTIRVLIKTTPGMQWAVQRGYNRLVKKHFNAAGIELPYPHTVVYFGQDKNGYAPAARVRATVANAAETNLVPDVELVPDGSALAPGYTRRALQASKGARSEDVLGNELDTVVDDEGERKEPPVEPTRRT